MDVTEEQVKRYKDEVLKAQKRGVEHPRLRLFLGGVSRTHGDVSRKVWEDYGKHVLEHKENAMLLHDYMDKTYAGTTTQLLFEDPQSTADKYLPALTGKPDVAIAFSSAIKRQTADPKFQDRMEVAEAALQKMDEVYLNENKGDPRVMMTTPTVPLETAGYTVEPGTEDLVKEALIKLFNVLNSVVTPRMIQAELNRRWSTKSGVFSRRSNTYVPLKIDPRTVPKECAEKDLMRMHDLFRQVAYGKDGARVKNREEEEARIKNLKPEQLIDLEQYLHWLNSSLRAEINDGKLKMRVSEMHSDHDLLKLLGQSEIVEPPATMMGAVRSRIMKHARDGAYHGKDMSHIIPQGASFSSYPNPSDPTHVFHVQALAGKHGTDALTSREKALFRERASDPLPDVFSADEYTMAAALNACTKRLGWSPDDAIDPDELITHTSSVLDSADSDVARRTMMAMALAAHTGAGNHGKPLLDITGPVMTVQGAHEAEQNGGWKNMSVRKAINVARGLNEILNAKGDKDSTHEVLERAFNTSDYMPSLRSLVSEAAMGVQADPGLSRFKDQVKGLAAMTGVHDPFESVVRINSDPVEGKPPIEIELYTSSDEEEELPVPLLTEEHESPFWDSEEEEEEQRRRARPLEGEVRINMPPQEDESFFEVAQLKAETPFPVTTAPKPVQPSAVAKPEPSAPIAVPARPLSAMFVPLSVKARGLLEVEKPRDKLNRMVIVDPDEFRGCVVLQPAEVRTPGNTWNKNAHFMRVTVKTLAEFKKSGLLLMDDGSRFDPADVLSGADLASTKARILKIGPSSDAVLIPIPTALKEVPLKR